jgi:hypothetical protein
LRHRVKLLLSEEKDNLTRLLLPEKWNALMYKLKIGKTDGFNISIHLGRARKIITLRVPARDTCIFNGHIQQAERPCHPQLIQFVFRIVLHAISFQ